MRPPRWLPAIALTLAACGRTELEPLAGGVADDAGANSAIRTAADASCESGRWTFGPVVTYSMLSLSGDENGGAILGVGHFDGDGALDLLALVGTPPSVEIWRNLGDGTLARFTTVPLDLKPYVTAVGDFNGDGLTDFVVGFADSSNVVEVFTNQGGGRFALTSSFEIEGGALQLTVADFDGDGAPDILVDDDYEHLNIVANRGDGTFSAVVSYADSALFVETMAVGDVNNDGALDIVTASSVLGASVTVVLNQGNGTFGSGAVYPGIYDDTGPLALGDFNSDGWSDIVRSGWQSGADVAVRLNNGDGTFGLETGYPAAQWPWGIAVGRFLTTDGPLDIVTSSIYIAADGGSTLALLPGVGNGKFGAPRPVPSPLSNTVVVGDFNGDYHPDVAFSAFNAIGIVFFVCEP